MMLMSILLVLSHSFMTLASNEHDTSKGSSGSRFTSQIVTNAREGAKPESEFFDFRQQPQFLQQFGNWNELSCDEYNGVDGGKARWKAVNGKGSL